MNDAYAHVGNVYYNAHSASPLVIGDFQIMKGWKGNGDGNDDNEVIDIGSGKVFTCDLDLVAPDVFVKGNEVVLMTEMDSHGLLKDYTLEELQGPLSAKCEEPETFEIDVPSGAIVVNIAYNATPEEGSTTDHLDKLCWHNRLPFLPKEPPKEPYYAKDAKNPEWRGHCIVPVKPGRYAIEMGSIDGPEGEFMRVVLRPKK